MNRFRRDRDVADDEDGGVALRERDRDETRVARSRTTTAGPTADTVRARGREEFGGISWGATLLGYLSSFGLAAILIALLSAAGAAIGLTKISDAAGDTSAEAIGLGGAIGLLVALCLAYFIGGYVAGRMSRFDGARQGVGVWLWGLIITVGLALLGVVLGDQYNVLNKLDLPRVPVGEGTLTTGGLITLAAVLIGTLLAAVAGGKLGERYHRRIDRYALDEVPTA